MRPDVEPWMLGKVRQVNGVSRKARTPTADLPGSRSLSKYAPLADVDSLTIMITRCSLVCPQKNLSGKVCSP